MTKLYKEILQRFPEIGNRISEDPELPYVLMAHIVEWIEAMPPEMLTPDLVGRILAFTKWCEKQPRRKSASTDIYTILVVGFYERLFRSNIGRLLLTKIISKEDLNADYFKTWVGEENYNEALKQYVAKLAPPDPTP